MLERRRLSGLAILALALGACAQSPEEQRNLALYCQVKSCLCVPEVRHPFSKNEPVELLWRDNGDATCPKGYKLDPTEKPKGFKSRYGG